MLVWAGLFLLCLSATGQNAEKEITARLADYFSNFSEYRTSPKDRTRIEKVCIGTGDETVAIYLSELFAGQTFDRARIKTIYREVKDLLPAPYNQYKIQIYASGMQFHESGVPLEQLASDLVNDEESQDKRWGDRIYEGAPWVKRADRPYSVSKGMDGCHLAVWASHGRVYKNEKKEWGWQRPPLYCTTEDLFTQTFVIPFLIPMLEHAGAYVFTPRERDWQTNEVIVDNDTPSTNGTYAEYSRQSEWTTCGKPGFARWKPVYANDENPFVQGTLRCATATPHKAAPSEIYWTPQIPEAGRYAVYVAYQALEQSIPDAEYTVCHRGISTTYKVNQQMGGGTWVYLGTFDFDAGTSRDNCVRLTTASSHRGIVTADAVRFGGGMGNIARGDSLQETVSGLPRYLEGARYNAQWSGMPYAVYGGKGGTNDYGDDINARSLMVNYLAGGSTYVPADSGLHVPFELSFALHSDAGIAAEPERIGTLGIITTGYNEGQLPSGLSRFASRDLCDAVMTQVHADLSTIYGDWKRRQMFDRNYSETREPKVPSMILEMLSHQNFKDLYLGHDPMFKFDLSRAIYKAILKYTACQHGTDYVVQPLPVRMFRTALHKERNEVILEWNPQVDKQEKTALPKGYIVYTRCGDKGYDNGTYTKEPRLVCKVDKDVVYSFKVTAVNEGGESFPSEELCAMIASGSKAQVLIIDGFQRLAGPQVVDNGTAKGFDIDADPGVPYHDSPGFCGRQIIFDTAQASCEEWGFSGNELEGKMLAGNKFTHTLEHGEAIATVKDISFASVSREAVEKHLVDFSPYHVTDLILGLQRDDGYSSRCYPTLTPALCEELTTFTQMRGSLLVSGAYIGRDQKTAANTGFLRHTLKVDGHIPVTPDEATRAEGMNTTLSLYTTLGDRHYAVTHADGLIPCAPAFTTLLYSPVGLSAAVAYQGKDYRTVTLGFPFECIRYASDRDRVMSAFLSFLLAR